ncbi:protease SohB [Litorivivens sp.]|uniref:protease SohB n=1 Tax=Litorivivens sp. TaxID=2020868 RepID=UPI0035632CC5
MEFLSDYGLFLAKTVTFVVALLIVIGSLASLGSRKRDAEGHIEVTALNDRFEDWEDQVKSVVLDETAFKQDRKEAKKKYKAEQKAAKKHKEAAPLKPRLYVLDFDGDIKASAVEHLRHEISAVLTLARPEDEILVKLESGGGMVHSYGLAASQLDRIRSKGIPLTVAIDRVAASGGYMMACIANRIMAAPFAVVGSIGVIAQLPNFHRLLKQHNVDFEMHTAGDYKRTLTVFGENTDEGREKFLEELEETHQLFKEFVSEHRPQVAIEKVATGEVWYGSKALLQNLVDEIRTSDEYILSKREQSDIFEVKYVAKKTLAEKVGVAAHSALDAVIGKWVTKASQRPLA